MTKKPWEELFYCTAEHYKGDRAHYWYIDEQGIRRNYWPEGRPPKKITRCCEEHQKPVLVTPEQLLKGISIEGYQGKLGTETYGCGKNAETHKTVVLEGDGVTIQMVFYKPTPVSKRHSYDQLATGHTSFTTDKGERTFDRTGVEDSFYLRLADGMEGAKKKIEGQLKRVAESRQRIKGMITVPGLGWLVSPEGKAEITNKLKAGKYHEFRPAGFGTGNLLYCRPAPRSQYDKRAAKATEEFFGVSPIWIQETDCD